MFFQLVKLPKRSLCNVCIVCVLSIACLLPLWSARHLKYLNDDSYISLTYAKSLAQGRGFVFNHPPATLGTTAPLFVFVIAALSRIVPSVEIARLAVYFSALCWIGIVWALFIFRRSLDMNAWQAGILGLIVIASGWLNVKYLGMESYMFAFLLTVSIVLFYRGLFGGAGVVAGLLFLTRGEGVLALFVLMITGLIMDYSQRKKIDVQSFSPAFLLGIGFSIPALIWFFYAYRTFGCFFPNTLAAKMSFSLPYSETFLYHILDYWVPLWGRQFSPIILPYFNVWWFLVILGLVAALLQKRKWLLFAGWIICYVGGYHLLGAGWYVWYFSPIVFVLHIFAALGLIKCVEMLYYKKIALVTPLIAILLVGSIVLTLGNKTISMIKYSDKLYILNELRTPVYLNLCTWIRENTLPSQSIAYVEIGFLGYFTDNKIIDLFGLLQPDITAHVRQGDWTWGFWHYKPDFYIHLPAFNPAFNKMVSSPEFGQQYREVARLPFVGNNVLIIYKNKVRQAQ